MKNKALKIINLIIAALVCAFAIGYAFAWFPESRRTDDVNFNGSSGQTYFAGGSGTEQDPFIINDKYHLYNLAWLQNTGKLNTKYYFELDGDLSIPENFWLPPIGTDEYEFIGDFNGKGYLISGLQITTDKSKLSKVGLPSGSGVFSNAVGMFGMTGSGSEIHNFVLDKPIVEVATANTTYSQSSDRTVGIAIGMVSGKAYSIGVLADEGGDGAQLLLNRAGYSTFNSIIGALKANTTSSVTGGGYLGSGGSGSSFGASFDVEGLLTRLEKIEENKNSDFSSWLLPDIDNSSANPVVVAGEKIAFTVTENSTYTGTSAVEEVAFNNVGYFTGNQNKIQTKKLTFGSKLSKDSNNYLIASDNMPNWFYKIQTTDESGNIVYPTTNYTTDLTCATEMDEEEFSGLPDSIKSLLVVDDSNIPLDLSDSTLSKSYDTVRLQTQYWGGGNVNLVSSVSTTDGNVAWAYHGQISWMGETYGTGFRNSDGYAVDEAGNYLDKNGNVVGGQSCSFNAMLKGVPLPSNAIWFKPAQAGTIRLVMYAEAASDAFALVKCVRNEASQSDPFALDWAADADNNGGWTTAYATLSYIFMHQLPANVLFYYEYEITEDDMVNGTYPEFMICKGNTSGGGAYFLYLDIGSSAADDNDASVLDPDTDVSAIDFIYRGVTISQDEEATGISVGNFIINTSGSYSAYEATKTSVYFENLNTILQIVFVRPENGKNADGVTLIVTVSGRLDEIKQTKTTALIT